MFFQKPDLHSAPPDVTTGLVEHSAYERPQMASVRGIPRGHGRNVLETADGKKGSSPVLKRQSASLSVIFNVAFVYSCSSAKHVICDSVQINRKQCAVNVIMDNIT